MPTDTALGAALTALRAQLADYSALWAGRVYLDEAPQGTAYPYLILSFVGGGAANRSRIPDAELVIRVKAVGASFSTANACALQVSRALDDAGHYDINSAVGVVGGWLIATITEEETFTLPENTPDGKLIYHVGAAYRVVMAGG